MINTWILILTLIGTDGVFITNVGPFSDASSCRAAGQEWFNRTYPNFTNYNFRAVVPNYTCVKQ